MRAIFTSILTLLALHAIAVQGVAGPYRVDLVTDPAVIAVGRAKLLLKLTDSSGQPVTGATVRALVKMPGMSMGEREETATPGAQRGTYTAPAVFAMSGAYESTISIEGSKGRGTAVIPLSTGQSTAGQSGFPVARIAIWALVAVAVILVLVQMRRSGQSIRPRGLFNRQVVLSLLILGAAAAIAYWVVGTQRREGAMTPIEAQVMDMNSPAPEGTLPVRLATAERRAFAPTVNYSGQAVGFVEQDVVPRVTGAIVSMDVYVGDRVRKGQVLARLDTSQLDPMVREKIAGVNTAQQGVGVAAMEYQQALSMITQARAEVTMAQGELAGAIAMQRAAEQGRGSAESDIASAQAEVQAMQADLTAAQADASYQQQDLARSRTLFDKGAISKDEWQRAQAEAQKSSAMVVKAQEAVKRAQAMTEAARAGLRKADAEIGAARRKVQQAQANVRAKEASVKTAESAARAAKNRVGQSEAGVAEASAGLSGAAAQRGYAVLRAEVDGVVTQRLISPGTVVNPGQAVLKVAQIAPIRLQANVPESDLARIKVGASVRVTGRGTSDQPVIAKVTSVSPSFDPNSRTGIVEALYSNPGARFLPGQYVSMDIELGSAQDAVVIPASAVQRGAGADEKDALVWLAQPEPNGEFTVARRQVEIGDASGSDVAVRTGLEPGARVVISPPQGLTDGVRVSPVTPPLAEGGSTTVEISASGYSPSSLTIPAGKPVRLTFIRKASESCGTEVIFPDLGLRKDLPLNQPVEVDIPAQQSGRQLSFNCGMNMLKGKVVVR